MTDTELLSISTEELEAMSDEQLVAALGPMIQNCRPLPGSEEEEKARKQLENEAKELAELELETNGAETADGQKIINGIVIGRKKAPRAKKTKAEKTNEQMKKLLAAIATSGISGAQLVNSLPKEIQFKK